MGNSKLNRARSSKKDEFYTPYNIVEEELSRYKDSFKGAVVYCNCDDAMFNMEKQEKSKQGSNFWNFLYDNFKEYGLRRLISTGYKEGDRGVKYEYDGIKVTYEELDGDGSFDSPECVSILERSDIVCTNPPFSLFRPYMDVVIDSGVNYIVMGNHNAVAYKEIFPLILKGDMWLGNRVNKATEFILPEDAEYYTRRNSKGVKFGRVPGITWYTNLEYERDTRNRVIYYKRYYGNEEEYPVYDNYDIIEVNRTHKIPVDYCGLMGVPVSFLSEYDPEEFELHGTQRWYKSDEVKNAYTGDKVSADDDYDIVLDGKVLFNRLFIKRRMR